MFLDFKRLKKQRWMKSKIKKAAIAEIIERRVTR
jgi:hypothetical protein